MGGFIMEIAGTSHDFEHALIQLESFLPHTICTDVWQPQMETISSCMRNVHPATESTAQLKSWIHRVYNVKTTLVTYATTLSHEETQGDKLESVLTTLEHLSEVTKRMIGPVVLDSLKD